VAGVTAALVAAHVLAASAPRCEEVFEAYGASPAWARALLEREVRRCEGE